MLLLYLPKIVFNFFVCFYYFLYILLFIIKKQERTKKCASILQDNKPQNTTEHRSIFFSICSNYKIYYMFVLSLYLNKNIYYLIYGYPVCIHVRYSEQRKKNVIGWLINPDNMKITISSSFVYFVVIIIFITNKKN